MAKKKSKKKLAGPPEAITIATDPNNNNNNKEEDDDDAGDYIEVLEEVVLPYPSTRDIDMQLHQVVRDQSPLAVMMALLDQGADINSVRLIKLDFNPV
jgi:hypothetical protein